MRKPAYLSAFKYLAIVACVAAAGSVLLVQHWLTKHPPFRSDDPSPASIEANAEIELPPSAANVRARIEGLNEITTWVRFDMDPADLPSFLQSTLCDTSVTLTDAQRAFQTSPDLSWWNPEEAQELHECRGTAEHFSQHILVDVANPHTYTVYVIGSVMSTPPQ